MEKIQVQACFAKLVSEESNARGVRAKLRTERVPFEGCATTAAVFVVGEYWSFRWTLSGVSIKAHAFHQIHLNTGNLPSMVR